MGGEAVTQLTGGAAVTLGIPTCTGPEPKIKVMHSHINRTAPYHTHEPCRLIRGHMHAHADCSHKCALLTSHTMQTPDPGG